MKMDPVQDALRKTIIETHKRLSKRKNGPSAELLASLARCANVYLKLKLSPGKTGRTPVSSTPKPEDMTPEQWQEYCFQHGMPGHYESLLE